MRIAFFWLISALLMGVAFTGNVQFSLSLFIVMGCIATFELRRKKKKKKKKKGKRYG